MRRLAMLMLFGAVPALGIPATAAASHHKAAKVKVTTVSQTVPVPAVPGQTASATATCPGKAQAVAGGFATNTLVNYGPVPVVYESQRVGTNQWRVSAASANTFPGGGVTAFAYCRKVTKVKTASGTTPVSAPTSLSALTVTATATCPGRTKAIGGGFSTTPFNPPASAPKILVEGSSGSGANAWTATVFDSNTTPSATNTGQVSSFAYCIKGKAPRGTTGAGTVPASTSTANPHGSATSAACPKKRKLVSGGFSAPVVAGPPISEPLVYESRALSATQWVTSAVQSTGPIGPGPLNVYGYCG